MPFPVFGTIYLDAVRVEINNNLLDVLDITTNVAPEEPCLGGQVNATIEICNNVGCDGNSFSNPATLVTAQLPPGLTLIPNADFPSLTHLVNEGDIPPGGCVVLTLALQVSSDEAFDGQTLPINLQFNPLAPCFDGAVLNAGNVTPMICTSEFACPCTEANTLNIVASPNGTPYSSLNLPATLDPSVHNGCIAIAGRLIMDQHVTITGCDNIRMQPCAEIVVPAFRHLTMEYSIIYGCEQMWQRIRAEPYSYLTFRHNKVSDGQHVLWAEPVTLFGLLTPTRVDIQHNRFERNHVNLFVPGNGGGFYGGVVWQTPFVGNNILCKGPGNTLGDLLPPCDAGLDNYDGEHGYAGAVVLGANFNIGAAGGAYNTFSNLRNGVIGERVFLNVYRSNFNNMIGFSDFQPSFALSRGVGVVANNGIYNVRDANFNGAGHALYGSNAFLSLRGSTTNKVRLGVEAWHPGARGVFDNPGIRFTDFGIRAWNLAASPWFSSHVIDKNKFFTQDVQAATDGDWTVQLVNLSNLTLPDGAGRISRNEMYVNDQVGGLLVNNLNNWAITDNRVEFSAHPNSEVLGSAGIQLQTSHYNYLYGNDITDVTGVGFNATTGFATLASLGNRFCCNGTEGGFVGSLFMGACFGTQYRQTDMASHGFSLWLPGNANTGFTVIGQQPIQVLGPATNSNRFGAASGTAWNDGPPLVLDASKFFVTNQNTPHYPQQIVTPNGVPSNWFVTNDATPYECAQDIQCPDPAYPPGGREDIEPTDILIAQNAFGSITGGAALQWEGERDLYARLKAHPDMLGQSTSVDAFYSATEAGSAVQSFHIAEAMVASVQDVPTAWGQALRTAADSIAAIEAEADAVLAALGGVSTRSDSLDIYWQSQSVRARLVPHTAVAVEKQHQMDSLRRIRALAVLPTVMALPANNVPQSNRKDALRIYLEVTSAGTAQLTEAQFDVVSPIAHQCPLAGGSAVYMARALYQMKEQKHFDDFDLCAIADGRSAKATPKPHADRVLLWPNPTDGRLQLFLPGMEAGQEVRLRVADISGRTVLERSLVTADGNLALDASRLVPGVYFCQVSTGGQTFQPVKFVIAR
ncbi:MAG: T9SS type A sorting domain-containing protein [Saprospiraceae bacterium]|nr:T9SS type A sorting domain-containing protein [Saprospiraceae bacterium]MDW8231013.1 T9SS type A sorting domain-containing protein [Saprospiraceae bacterium]